MPMAAIGKVAVLIQQWRDVSRKAAPGRTAGPAQRHGVASTGRIVKLLIGQNHGFIRRADGREIYFHRSDLREGTSFNDFAIGDAVSFELLEDVVSGARALGVKRRPDKR